jgi:hypothetical protein
MIIKYNSIDRKKRGRKENMLDKKCGHDGN